MRASTLFGLGALAVLAACYNPSFTSGSLACGGSSASRCPDGHFCHTDGYCYKNGSVPGPVAGSSGGNMGMGGTSGSGGGGTGGMSDLYGPFPGCAAESSGRCDPVCQSGCSAGQRCNFEDTSPVCRTQAPPFKNLLEACNASADTCKPGTICLAELRPEVCGAHCYKYCREDNQCPPNARCAVEVQVGNTSTMYKVCSPPIDPPCSPIATAGNPARCQQPRANFGCYVLSSKYPDFAVCDCAGTVKGGEKCTYEHQCEPGWECVNLGGESLCRKVCQLGVTSPGCPVTQICTPFLNAGTPSQKFGFCRVAP